MQEVKMSKMERVMKDARYQRDVNGMSDASAVLRAMVNTRDEDYMTQNVEAELFTHLNDDLAVKAVDQVKVRDEVITSLFGLIAHTVDEKDFEEYVDSDCLSDEALDYILKLEY